MKVGQGFPTDEMYVEKHVCIIFMSQDENNSIQTELHCQSLFV